MAVALLLSLVLSGFVFVDVVVLLVVVSSVVSFVAVCSSSEVIRRAKVGSLSLFFFEASSEVVLVSLLLLFEVGELLELDAVDLEAAFRRIWREQLPSRLCPLELQLPIF